eukprot:jgi/Galph1/3799/GphlegSOOS_G2458.1
MSSVSESKTKNTVRKKPKGKRGTIRKKTSSSRRITSSDGVVDMEDIVGFLSSKDSRNTWISSIEEIQNFQRSILEWYKIHQRQLPWRQVSTDSDGNHPNPYQVWISEVFPNLKSLAESSLERVNEVWSGLGYYRRAKLLHQGAKTVMAEFGGNIPQDFKILQKIPGIGHYTAAAISSIAFNKPHAVCDGNVIRLLSRLFSIDLDVSVTGNQSFFRNLAQFLVPTERVGDYNQAMMDLGATICTPKKFVCSQCPVQKWCNSFQVAMSSQLPLSQIVGQYPIKTKKAKQNQEELIVYVICFSGHFLLFKNSSTELLANLWHFPFLLVRRNGNSVISEDETINYANIIQVLNDCGCTPVVTDCEMKKFLGAAVFIGQVEHLFTHIKQVIHVKCLYLSPELKVLTNKNPKCLKDDKQPLDYIEYRWLDEKDISKCAISKQMKKVFELFRNRKSQRSIEQTLLSGKKFCQRKGI